MENESTTKLPGLCPVCGSHILNPDAKRCPVCGSEIEGKLKTKKTTRETPLRGSRMPEVSLNIPIMIILILILMAIGGVATYFVLDFGGRVAEPTATITVTVTVTPSITPTPLPPTATLPPQPTLTPVSHVVAEDESCGYLAAVYGVSVRSIIQENSLDANCSLVVGNTVRVPQPTPTNTPVASPTPNATQLAISNCQSESIEVEEEQTLEQIAAEYNVPADTIRYWNGLSSEAIFTGQSLVIPLCSVSMELVNPAPTLIPTYIAPKLLLPGEGASFTLENNEVVLQWSSVSAMKENQYFQVTLLNSSDPQAEPSYFYVKDTKFIVPESFRPSGNTPMIFRWTIQPVEKTGETEDGEGIYIPVGAVSLTRVFSWSGSFSQ